MYGPVFNEHEKGKFVFVKEVKEQHGENRFFEGPLKLTVECSMAYPSRVSERKQQEMDGKMMNQGPTVAAILHTIGKLCTGVLFLDDIIIAESSVEKRYSMKPQTKFTLTEISYEKKKQ